MIDDLKNALKNFNKDYLSKEEEVKEVVPESTPTPIETIQKEEVPESPKVVKTVEKQDFDIMDFPDMCRALGLPESEIERFHKKYSDLNNLEDWFNEAWRIYCVRFSTLNNMLVELQHATLDDQSDKNEQNIKLDVTTKTKKCLLLLDKLVSTRRDDMSSWVKILEEISKVKNSRALAGVLDAYDEIMDQYYTLILGGVSMCHYYADGYRIISNQLLDELYKIRGFEQENKKLKNDNQKLLSSILTIENKYKELLKEINDLKILFNIEEAKHESSTTNLSQISTIPKPSIR